MPKRGTDYSASDADRMGVFKEMGYLSAGDPYKDPKPGPFRKPKKGLKDFQTSPNKKGQLFEHKFARAFEGEAISDPVKEHRKAEKKAKAKMVAGPFKPTRASQKAGGAGAFYGTFSGTHQYLSPVEKPKKKAPKEPRNFLTNPPKRGTAGVPGVTLGTEKFLKHGQYGEEAVAERQRAKAAKAKIKGGAFRATNPEDGGTFHKNPYKLDSGKVPKGSRPKAKAAKKIATPFYPTKGPAPMSGAKNTGGFDKFPEYKPEKPKAKAAKREAKVFRPTARAKPLPTKSVMSLRVNKTVHAGNYSKVAV